MKIYKLSTLEEYKNFVRDAGEADQPIFVYISVDNSHIVGISQRELFDPEKEIARLMIESDDLVDEDQPLFDDDDDFDDPLLLIL